LVTSIANSKMQVAITSAIGEVVSATPDKTAT